MFHATIIDSPSFKATRRRPRKFDPHATPEGVESILDQLRQDRPELISYSNKKMESLLNAVRHVERYPATDTAAGRPGKWKRQTLLEVAQLLRSILDRGTSGKVSLSSFTGLYLRVLHFPADVAQALQQGDINLQEATILARLTEKQLGIPPAKAEKLRREIIANHIKVNGSQNGLRDRVRTALGQTDVVSTATMTAAVELEDELLKIDPKDKRHLFY